MATSDITVRLIAEDLMSGNISKAIGSIDKLAKRGGLVGSVMQGVGQKFGQMLNPVGLMTRGIGAVTDALGDSLDAYREDQKSQAQLKTALEANIKAWDGNTDAIEKVIEARMELGFSDDEQRSSLALLIAQVQNVSDALKIQRTAMDLARLRGTSLAESASMLAKAYNGSATGLQRMGIKIDAGTRGMKALGQVQQRVAGQAEAWGKTSAGAAAAFDVKVGELQEKIGGLVDGPARLFIDFLSGVVDVIDGPSGASASIRDLTGTIVMLRTQADGMVRGDPFERLAEDLGGWNQQLRQAEELYSESTWFKWMARLGPDTLRNFGKASAETFADVEGLAKNVIEAGGSFGEFAMIVRQKVAPSFNILTGAWTGLSEASGTATDEIVHQATRIKAVPFQMLRSLTDVKAEWKAGWKNLAEWAKDPFRPEAFQRYINRQVNKALEKAKDPGSSRETRRNWRKIATAMKSPILAALVDMGMSLDVAVAKIIEVQAMAKRIDPLSIVVTGAGGGNGGGGQGDGPPTGHNAAGTSGWRGGWTWVGERGPELMHLPRGTAITPNHAIRGGDVHVHFHGLVTAPSEAEGQRLARTIAPHLRREMARSGR